MFSNYFSKYIFKFYKKQQQNPYLFHIFKDFTLKIVLKIA